ncbi:ABC transporter ATP-binding protein [Pararhizobium antarcticum]|uniref:Iron ABC transporter ATP-binding protein n=1 Tax=Pararhizobium antarcticum TaxID=1798805 RepID=A0A657LVG0_9HYPH|nr:ABC transporter ATP-binding protein [Pararhizobium antarcticum]OJF91960.1 iron ABC transporter ATP-binding protein [Rhizobium sp. 58]OJF98343.1 iron ABC transporter ATP-binding protein [Pararhizobium antarcticum]
MNCRSEGSGLAARSLCWGPRAELMLVRDVSFSIVPGDRLVILGPNGAGKSSLLRCLFRAVKPLKGSVEIDGDDLWQLSARDAARKIAVVLQEMPADFPFSVLDVVTMGRIPRRQGMSGWTELDREHVHHALDHLDLAHLATRQFTTLSGGEKQRVLVARALAQEPQIVILDEPTNHLDIRHQLEILTLLRSLGLTIVTTLHDINLAVDFATRIAIMQDGRMTCFGVPSEVLTSLEISRAFSVTATAHSKVDGDAPRFSFSLTA